MIGIVNRVLHRFTEQIDRDDRFALTEVQIIGDLILRGLGMDHVGDGADAVQGIKALHCLRDIRQAQRHRVALLDPQCLERLGTALDPPDQLTVGDQLTVELQGVILRIDIRALLHHLIHRQAGIIDHIVFVHVFASLIVVLYIERL